MAAVRYPGKDGSNPRKITKVPIQNWDLNASGLYSFKVVRASPEGSISIVADDSQFNEFVLPINPTNLQVSIPFAINVSATTGGISEEHNGSVFRMVSISGSFGVAPGDLRNTMVPSPGTSAYVMASLNSLNTLSGGVGANTIGAIGATVNAASGVFSQLKLPGIKSGIDVTEKGLQELGFAKINEFGNYLVAYAEYKKTEDGRDARLLFIDRKHGVTYVVTPITFDTTKDAGEPHNIKYRVMLRAWDLAGQFPVPTRSAADLGSGITVLAAAFNTLRAARSTLAAASLVIRGVVSDYDNLIKIVNEVGLLLKDATGVAKSFADFDEIAASKESELRQASPDLRGLTSSTILDATNPSGRPVPGAVQNAQAQQLRDSNNPLRSPEQRLKLIDALDKISVNSIALTSADKDAMNTKLARVRAYTIADFDSMRARFESARESFSDSIGLNDVTYDAVLKREPAAQIRLATSNDYKTLKALNDLVAVMDSLTTTKDVVSTRLSDPFVRAQVNSGSSDLRITPYNNGYPIPFPTGATLEGLAAQYLGSPTKVQEIIIANGLKPPYIDEEGFTRFFKSSGVGNQFTIEDASNVHTGQEIFLSSSTQLASKRIIVSIRKLSVTSYVIEVDGSNDLANFKVVHEAKLLAYLPGTINSSKMITIPTNKDVVSLLKGRSIALTENMDRQQKAMGVDFALDSNYDLAFTNNGDIKLVAGVANALQAVKIKLGLEKGDLKHHPEVGLGIEIGTRQLEVDADTLRAALENAVLSDPRFSALTSLNIQFEGNVTRLNLHIKAANGSDVIPLSYTIK